MDQLNLCISIFPGKGHNLKGSVSHKICTFIKCMMLVLLLNILVSNFVLHFKKKIHPTQITFDKLLMRHKLDISRNICTSRGLAT